MSNFFTFDQDSRKIDENTDEGCLPEMSFKDRVIAFCTCLALSILIEIVSFGSLIGLITGSPTRYAISMTLGNILSIVGSGFLLGFRRQMKSSFDSKRRITTIVYFSSIVLMVISLVFFPIKLLILALVILQYCAFVWYIASYFPWGREILIKCFKKCCGKCTDEEN